MSLFSWWYTSIPNPDLVGNVKVTAEHIDPERLQAHQEKLARARAYIAERGISIPPAYRTRKEA